MNDKTYELMRITYESHGRKYAADIPWDSNAVTVIQTFAGLMQNAGFTHEAIGRLINSKDDIGNGITVWEWDE